MARIKNFKDFVNGLNKPISWPRKAETKECKMGALGLQEVSEPTSTETEVSLATLSKLTGFPMDYIKRELLLDGEEEAVLNVEELRTKVLAYLDSKF